MNERTIDLRETIRLSDEIMGKMYPLVPNHPKTVNPVKEHEARLAFSYAFRKKK